MAAAQSTNPMQTAHDWYSEFQRFVLAQPSLGALAQLLGKEAAFRTKAPGLQQIHNRAIGFMHISRKPEHRTNFAKVVNAFVGGREASILQELVTAGENDPEVEAWTKALHSPGYTSLPEIGAEKALRLRDWLEAGGLLAPGEIHKSPQEVTPQSADVLRQTENLAHAPPVRVLEAPGLAQIATEPRLLEAVRQHLGAPPVLIDISAWQSFAGRDGAKEAREAQLFHFDLDDYRFCKMFVYLTDVDEDGGPHIFVPDTHRMETILACRSGLTADCLEVFDKWYFGQLRKSEQEVKDWIGQAPVALTGKMGSRYLVNTEGIHRGEPPRSHDRWVLQLVYGITPHTFWHFPYTPPVLRDWDGAEVTPEGEAARYALHLLAPSGRQAKA